MKQLIFVYIQNRNFISLYTTIDTYSEYVCAYILASLFCTVYRIRVVIIHYLHATRLRELR